MSGGAATFSPFRARMPWWGPDLQTLRNYLLRDYPDLSAWPAEPLAFSMTNGDRLSASFHSPAGERERPTVVLVHGFTGCADSAYMFASAKHLLENGFPVLRLNLRGAGPTRADCRELYHAGRSDDFRQIVAALPDRITRRGLTAVGFSLGGNMLMKYLGEEGAATPLQAAVSVSAPIDLIQSTRRINAFRNRVYHRWLVANAKQEWLSGPSILDAKQVEKVHKSRTLYELDDGVVGPLNGFTGADDYYNRCSAESFLPAIEIPTLVIHADNDPWIPAAIYRRVNWSANKNLVPQITAGGGHVGFHGRGGRWHDNAIVQFFGQSAPRRLAE